MRANLFSRISPLGRLTGLALVTLAAAGCKTEKDPDDPTLLGAPPSTAYIGVEYYYNWGAYGGEDILDYSLTNAPAWLALEDTSNKARQGVIMRGVPGLTGGNRGTDDIRTYEDIDIVTTDGRMAGFQPFDIEVKHNLLSTEAPEFTEGEASELPDPQENECALPDLEPVGKHNGLPTRRVYTRVELDQPSVTRVSVAFELRSDFQCDGDIDDCHADESNLDKAIVGRDLVTQGSESSATRDLDGNPLEYIRYTAEDQGVITLEPGITRCYIPLEVIDDRIAERTERAELVLTEVRDGLASLSAGSGDDRPELSTGLIIHDNEPTVSLQTFKAGTDDTLNVDESLSDASQASYDPNQRYKAILSGERKGLVRVRLTAAENGSTASASDFAIIQDPEELEGQDAQPSTDNELVFLAGQDEVVFSVVAADYANTEDSLDDLVAVLAIDELYQAGKVGYARGESDELMTLGFNRMTAPLQWNDGFEPTDVVMGNQGELFAAGWVPVTGGVQVQVRAYDQEGRQLGDPIEVTDVSQPVEATHVALALGERTERNNGARAVYNEMVVGYAAAGQIQVALYRQDKDTGAYALASENAAVSVGSDGLDTVSWVGYQDSNGNLLVAGESAATWEGETSSGDIDSFLAVIETTALNLVLRDVRQVGSAGADRALGGSTESGTPMLFGYAPRVLDGTGAIGPFFVSGTGDSEVFGVGTEASEQLSHGFFADGTAWLIGQAPWRYSVRETEEGSNELERSADSLAGFVLGYSAAGAPKAAISVEDADGAPVPGLDRGVGFDGDVVVAASDGFLGRVTPEQDAPAYRSWRQLVNVPGLEIIDLENYRDDEIVALIRSDEGAQILLFSPEGRLLTTAD